MPWRFSGKGAGHVLPLFLACALSGCTHHSPSAFPKLRIEEHSTETLAPGIVHRAIPIGSDAGIDLIDIDLTHARLAIITDDLRSARGRTFGTARTPAEWQAKTHALAVVNGGYFGAQNPDGRTEIMGLLMQGDKVRHAATVPHAAFGIGRNNLPVLTWAATQGGQVEAFTSPHGGAGRRPAASSLVGCGPMLVWNGQVHVTDHEERLVSPGARARTFVAADTSGQHLVIGIASAAEYREIAKFLMGYFPHYDHVSAGQALCLDGGGSSQLTYKLPDGTAQSPRMTGVAVPVALAVFSR